MPNADTEKIYQLILGYHGPTKRMIADSLRKGFAFDSSIPPEFHPEVKRSERHIPGSNPDQEIRCLVPANARRMRRPRSLRPTTAVTGSPF